jgi:hypothetical protein
MLFQDTRNAFAVHSKIKFRKEKKIKRNIWGLIIALIAIATTGCPNPSKDTPSDKAITLLAIPGVVAPVRGAAPVTTAISTAQYTGTISWTPADNPFMASTYYTANIVLAAKSGWTFTGVAADSFTVAGAAATNAANSSAVAAEFPVTDAPPAIDVAFLSVTQVGGASDTATTTDLILNFSVDPTGLAASNISVECPGHYSGLTKGALSGTGTTRTLAISGIAAGDNGATVSVYIGNLPGFSFTGLPQTTVIYKAKTNATFAGATQVGGVSGSTTTTALTLTFSVDPTTLTNADITIVGAIKGALSGTGATRNLAITGITAADGATVSVAVASPAGYTIAGSPETAVVYCRIAIGAPYMGGLIAYSLVPGDPGYNAAVPHGLIAATAEQSTGIGWAKAAYTSTTVPGTLTTLGSGSANTDKIIAQNGTGSTYAAGLARAYNGGGYADWYLPSKDELDKLYINKAAIGFVVTPYWSSSEGTTQNAAWGEYFGTGTWGNYGKDQAVLWLRAVRSF